MTPQYQNFVNARKAISFFTSALRQPQICPSNSVPEAASARAISVSQTMEMAVYRSIVQFLGNWIRCWDLKVEAIVGRGGGGGGGGG